MKTEMNLNPHDFSILISNPAGFCTVIQSIEGNEVTGCTESILREIAPPSSTLDELILALRGSSKKYRHTEIELNESGLYLWFTDLMDETKKAHCVVLPIQGDYSLNFREFHTLSDSVCNPLYLCTETYGDIFCFRKDSENSLVSFSDKEAASIPGLGNYPARLFAQLSGNGLPDMRLAMREEDFAIFKASGPMLRLRKSKLSY